MAEKALRLLADDPKPPKGPTPYNQKYAKCEAKIQLLANRIQRRDYELKVYEWSSYTSNEEQIKASSAILKDQSEIRAIMTRLVDMNSDGPRWDHLEEDSNGQIDLEAVSCTRCGKVDTTDDNDILLCDKSGCFRAYHQYCMDPPLSSKRLQSEVGEDWFCHQCTCYIKCVGLLEDICGGDFDTCDSIFPQCASEEAIDLALKDLRESLRASQHVVINGVQGSEEDEEDDVDFDPDVERMRSQKMDGGNDDDDDDDDSEVGYLSGDSETSVESLEAGELDELCQSNVAECASGPRLSRKFKLASPDSGPLDTRNILSGPRKRAKVDYVRLNEALFGAETGSDLDG